MTFSRREFLLGTAAGMVSHSFFDKAYAYFENHGEPFLAGPKNADRTLYAVGEWTCDGYQLNLGDITAEPEMLNLREFCEYYRLGDPIKWYLDIYHEGCYEGEPVNPEIELDSDFVIDTWIQHHSTSKAARVWLDTLDLGPQLSGAQAVGELRYSAGGMISNLDAYDAVDEITLSLLQNRLNELGQGVQIVMVR